MKTKLRLLTAAVLAAGFLTSCASTSGTASLGGAKPYPLKTCIVTDNDLDSMGDTQTIVHEGQTVKFCCEPCVAKFQKNPGRFLAKLSS